MRSLSELEGAGSFEEPLSVTGNFVPGAAGVSLLSLYSSARVGTSEGLVMAILTALREIM